MQPDVTIDDYATRVGQEVVRLLEFLRADEPAPCVNGLAVLLDRDTHNARNAPRRMFLGGGGLGGTECRKQRKTVENSLDSHCRENISGLQGAG